MNKKFSTLLTTALFMGGALFSEAYAESLKSYLETSPAAKVENGTKYVLIQKGVTANGAALGIEAFKDKVVTYRAFDAASDIDLNNLEIDDFLWTVNESTVVNGVYTVTFTNEKYSLSLNVLNDGTTLVTDYNTTTSGYSNRWVWEGYKTYENASPKRLYAGELALNEKINGTSNPLYVLNYDGSSSFHTQVVDGAIQGFDLYEVKDQEVPSDELNALYNSAGFNLKIAKDGITNAFDNGKTIKAVGVESGKVLTKNGIESATGFTGEGFPAGTYFLSETPAGKIPGVSTPDDQKELYSYLLNSTFVALSASDNVATSATVQATGEGFTLKEVAGKDLNLYLGTDANFVSSGTTVSVNNAAFTVMNNATNKDNYALSVANFRYKNSTAATHTPAAVGLAVKSNGSYGSSEYLVSDPAAGTNNFIFQFVESTIKNGSDLLNANGASIYNIKFVGGDVDGFYLTSARHNGNTANFAKGIVLTDPATPAFQYVITKVDGNDVTFTNRETGVAFTAKLFDKGNNKYTLALVDTDQSIAYTILNVQNNGDIEDEATPEVLNLSEIELVPVTSVDKFAGFMDEADEAKVTLTFARDEDPTSNKLYPVVNAYDAFNNMTDNVSEAAQWQLVKSEKPTYVTRTYAYIDADEKVAYKSEGDTVAYYTYEFQYVKDGVLKDLYINNGYLTGALQTTGTKYIVKENVDGSVNIMASYSSVQALSVNAFTGANAAASANYLVNKNIMQTSEATDIKAYIVLDAPEVTLPATATYVTLKSEVGNYSLGVDGERDAVYTTEPTTIRVFATDLKSEIPSFFVTTGWNEEDGSRMFLFNPSDSVNYYVGAGKYDKEYQWNVDVTKAIFKAAKLNAELDTLTTSILGKTAKVAMKADNSGVQGGLDYFKYQIFLADADEADDLYIVRTLADAKNGDRYLYQENGKFGWTSNREKAMKFYIDNVEAPTANEEISTSSVVIAGVDGAVVVKGAEGKNVIVSTILGKVVANEVVSSDNATIAAPAGIVVVSVDGESFKVVVK